MPAGLSEAEMQAAVSEAVAEVGADWAARYG